MKKDLVEMVFILDKSGSMTGYVEDTIGGFNSLIEKQKKEDGEAYVTTVLFDNRYELLHDHVPLNEIPVLTTNDYYPSGTTALLDAIGITINRIGERLSKTPEDERPEQVMIMITTDGLENASKEYTYQQVNEMIQHQQEKYSWVFMFLGAGMDAVKEASNLGIQKDFAKTYTKSGAGVQSVYRAVGASMTFMRNYSKMSVDEDATVSNMSESEKQKKRYEKALKEASAVLDSVE